MAITLFEHQTKAAAAIEKAWYMDNEVNVCSVLPTGAGKTILKGEMVRRELARGGLCLLFAHRDVLLEQISLALCAFGIEHNFMTSNATRRDICNRQVSVHGRSFYNERARVFVCSVDTFYRRDISTLAEHVTLWLMDETHHLLDSSKWHKCIDPLINARGLGVTATPIRADKKGLGRHVDGVFDRLITDREINATMHDLMIAGRLSTYKVFTPPPKIDMSNVRVTSSGDFNQNQLAKATDRAEITGDAVKHYQRLAHNKQTIIFTVNIAHSDHVAEQFRKAGYNAVSVSSKTKPAERNKIVDDFRNGRITILVNCDLFGEGFDVPAVECVIMLRKTESYSLFKQQFGRALRVIDGKLFGILIDHVGNVEWMMDKYNLNYPHDDPEWTLDRPTKKRTGTGQSRLITRVCPECFARYTPTSTTEHVCPECHHKETKEEEIDQLKKFQAKEGNLVELSIDVVEKIMQEREKVDKDPAELKHFMKNAPPVVRNSAIANHTKRLNAQTVLRDSIHRWCMLRYKLYATATKETVQREFEIEFGVHPMKAAILGEREANELREKIENA
jgi:superfamily II DNA or RNA helicase